MRHLAPAAFFAFCVVLAACGGGGGGAVPPTGGSSAGSGGGAPSQSTSTHATMVLHVPPASAQNPAAKRRFYISPGTQSFGVWVFPSTSTQTPGPSNVQLFPVATPSPCAAASGGGVTCTLVVTAPIGEDVFFLAAYATASPNLTTAIPLSVYESGAVDVSSGAAPAPLNFALNAVPDSVAVTVPSPDPGNTPNTHVFTVAVPTSVPLGITAYDASGNIVLADATTTFEPPIGIFVAPTNAGINLQLNSQCGATTAAGRRRAGAGAGAGGASTIAITCAADLDNVTLAYDGSIDVDSSDHVIDNVSIATSAVASPAPTPAYAVLQSNAIPYSLGLSSQIFPYDAWLTPTGSKLIYLVNNSDASAYTGTFDPSTGAVSAPAQLNAVVTDPVSTTIASDGSYWLVDASSDTIDCWSSYANAAGGAVPTQMSPPPPGSGPISLSGLAADGSGNIWWTGYDSAAGQDYAGYFPSGDCTAPSPFPTDAVALGSDSYDGSTNVVGLSNGIAYNSENSGLFVVTTSGLMNDLTPQLGAGSNGGGVAVDGAQTTYAGFNAGCCGSGDVELLTSGGGALATLMQLVPTSPVNGSGPDPQSLAAFSPTGGAADRLFYAENDFDALGVIRHPAATPVNTLENLPNLSGSSIWDVALTPKGGALALYPDNSSGATIGRMIDTTTWNLPVTTFLSSCSGTALATIDERGGDSGTFTWSFPAGGSEAAFPGSDHVFEITPPSLGTPFTAIVTDAHGRTEPFVLTVNNGCGG